MIGRNKSMRYHRVRACLFTIAYFLAGLASLKIKIKGWASQKTHQHSYQVRVWDIARLVL